MDDVENFEMVQITQDFNGHKLRSQTNGTLCSHLGKLLIQNQVN